MTVETIPDPEPRPRLAALWRGLRRRCPSCGEGALFTGYLRVAAACGNCGQALEGHRADDAPPYFTVLVVGHIVFTGVLLGETNLAPPLWLHLGFWLLLALVLALYLLPRFKGALIGLQWSLSMHGFGGHQDRGQDGQP